MKCSKVKPLPVSSLGSGAAAKSAAKAKKANQKKKDQINKMFDR